MLLWNRLHWLLASLVAVAQAGCDQKQPEPSVSEAPSAQAAAPAPATASARLNDHPATSADSPGIAWKDPVGFTRLSRQSPMRVATYRVDGKSESESGELAVFYFGPNSGGGVDANIARWRKQFPDVPDEKVRRSERTHNDLTQHIVEIERGTFSSGMPMGPQTPQKDFGLLAAIVETPTGHYFFKLTGPADTVQAARKSFMELLDSVRTKES